jgi:hypothetical protein
VILTPRSRRVGLGEALVRSVDSFNGFDSLPGQVQSQIDTALEDDSAGDINVSALQDCITHAVDVRANAGANQRRIDRCLSRFGP